VSGFADQLNASLLAMLDSGDGLISNKLNALDNDKLQIAEKRERLDTRMSAQESRLKSQFLFNDAIVSKLNSTGDFIKSQFDAMNNYGK
jgi:flagellar capping protein FliD